MPKTKTIITKFPHFSRRRLLWLFVILVVILLYFPVNQLTQHGTQLSLPIDANIPLYPPAIVPYLIGAALFVVFPVLAALYIKRGEFEAYAISILTATIISYLVYLTFPTFVTRPEITYNDIFSRAIIVLYQADKSFNAAPSGHTFYSVLACLYICRWLPKYKIIWIIIAAVIIASTLFTRQHYILDVICGLALGILAYFVGRFVHKKWNPTFAS
jgi:membrane-associated phospholipid phosphatase